MEKTVSSLIITHPTVGVAELMRKFDEHRFIWDEAGHYNDSWLTPTTHCCLKPSKNGRLAFPISAPRLLKLFEINRRFARHCKPLAVTTTASQCMSIIEEGDHLQVFMAHGIIGSFSGMGSTLYTDFLVMAFSRFLRTIQTSLTTKLTASPNAVGWQALIQASSITDKTIGPKWVTQLDDLQNSKSNVDDKKAQNNCKGKDNNKTPC